MFIDGVITVVRNIIIHSIIIIIISIVFRGNSYHCIVYIDFNKQGDRRTLKKWKSCKISEDHILPLRGSQPRIGIRRTIHLIMDLLLMLTHVF